MTFQVVKIVNIPIFPARSVWDKDSSITTEVWQPVGQTHSTIKDGLEALAGFREFNKISNYTYRLVEIVEEK